MDVTIFLTISDVYLRTPSLNRVLTKVYSVLIQRLNNFFVQSMFTDRFNRTPMHHCANQA